ncbi:NYN domain-containing protein [Moraxella canis]|uniref:NYN domain-containing protein n=1 Tax=Moraxella canis TaxID=90239 RepID=UPI0006682DF6|nr:NYN domain-containing protein [Moraxella canis]
MDFANKNVALFIDADNAPAKKIEFILSELAKFGTINIRKIYGDWKNHGLQGWEDVLLDNALKPVQQFAYTKSKNATDMAMTIDVMDILHENKVDVFCLVSSDSDFTPLVMRLRHEGKVVIGFGEQKTPKSLVQACSRFLYLDGENTNQNHTGMSKKSSNELKQDAKLMNLLRHAISEAQNEEGWASLSTVGSIIKNQSSFDSKNYGYKQLSDLVKAIDLFEVQLNDSHYIIKNKKSPKNSANT